MLVLLELSILLKATILFPVHGVWVGLSQSHLPLYTHVGVWLHAGLCEVFLRIPSLEVKTSFLCDPVMLNQKR